LTNQQLQLRCNCSRSVAPSHGIIQSRWASTKFPPITKTQNTAPYHKITQIQRICTHTISQNDTVVKIIESPTPNTKIKSLTDQIEGNFMMQLSFLINTNYLHKNISDPARKM